MPRASSRRPDNGTLAHWVSDARQRSKDLVADLDERDLLGPQLDIVNPLLWEIGHVAWFQETWVLRHALGLPPVREDADALWDSMQVHHDTRWELPLPVYRDTLAYITDVADAVIDVLQNDRANARLRYLIAYSVFHEDMHAEAFTYTRQTRGLAAPPFAVRADRGPTNEVDGDVQVPGGRYSLGATKQDGFVFDNEKWAHVTQLDSLALSRRPVTQAEYAEFVNDGGYDRETLWDSDGWRWRVEKDARHPVYWRRDGGNSWERREFDRWLPLEPDLPMIHANWFEASAYCRWAGRRLPTEAEWEAAALHAGDYDPFDLSRPKPTYPWGEDNPTGLHATLDARTTGCSAPGATVAGTNRLGCFDLIGNVWEWTSSEFGPFPGFTPDMYADYSAPWFHSRKVLRGGSWATRARLIWTTHRNFFTPDRRDVFAGFRTCALRT